jgi:hypothetical protein
MARFESTIAAYRVARRNAMDELFGDRDAEGDTLLEADESDYARWALMNELDIESQRDRCPFCDSLDVTIPGSEADPERHCNDCGLDFMRETFG